MTKQNIVAGSAWYSTPFPSWQPGRGQERRQLPFKGLGKRHGRSDLVVTYLHFPVPSLGMPSWGPSFQHISLWECSRLKLLSHINQRMNAIIFIIQMTQYTKGMGSFSSLWKRLKLSLNTGIGHSTALHSPDELGKEGSLEKTWNKHGECPFWPLGTLSWRAQHANGHTGKNLA